MGIEHKVTSIKALEQRKTTEELAAENEELKKQITVLQLALCEVYEAIDAAISAAAKGGE